MRINFSIGLFRAKLKTFSAPLPPTSKKRYIETQSFVSKRQYLKVVRIFPVLWYNISIFKNDQQTYKERCYSFSKQLQSIHFNQKISLQNWGIRTLSVCLSVCLYVCICHRSLKCNYLHKSLLKAVLIKIIMSVM